MTVYLSERHSTGNSKKVQDSDTPPHTIAVYQGAVFFRMDEHRLIYFDNKHPISIGGFVDPLGPVNTIPPENTVVVFTQTDIC